MLPKTPSSIEEALQNFCEERLTVTELRPGLMIKSIENPDHKLRIEIVTGKGIVILSNDEDGLNSLSTQEVLDSYIDGTSELDVEDRIFAALTSGVYSEAKEVRRQALRLKGTLHNGFLTEG